MRFLPISIFLLVLVGCGSYPKNQNFEKLITESGEIDNPYFSDTTKDYVYKTDIKIFKNSFSGIFIAKKLGREHHRIVFTTEMGNKLFDFEFQGKNFKINQILPEIDRKTLKNVLKRDFYALIKERAIPINSHTKENLTMMESKLLDKKHYYLYEEERLKKIVRADGGKEKVTFLFSGINDNIANYIQIKHQNVKLEINLKRL